MRYTPDHEWLRVEGKVGVVGITEFAVNKLGDVVYIELPEDGAAVQRKDTLLSLESVKAASDVYSPVGGKVVAANRDLVDAPGTVNKDPTGAGWMVKLELTDPTEVDSLMDEAAYKIHCEKEEDH